MVFGLDWSPSAGTTGFGEELAAAARGEVPSAAEEQMKMGLGRAQRGALGLARSQRGVNPALAGRRAQDVGQQMAMETTAQAGALRAQEQAAARQQYADYQLSLEQMKLQEQMAGAGMESSLWGAGLSAAGGLLGGLMSDKRAKTDVKKASEGEMDSFLDALVGYQYKYKKSIRPHDAKETHSGIMAQDLQKSSFGKKLVETYDEYITPPVPAKPSKEKKISRLHIKTGDATMAALAGLGHLARKVADLEQKTKK